MRFALESSNLTHGDSAMNDDSKQGEAIGWRERGPEAIANGLAPARDQAVVEDEALWLALNAWG